MADAGGMICLPASAPLWRNEHCTFLDPRVYGSVRLRCNHECCTVDPGTQDKKRRRLRIEVSSSDDEDLELPAETVDPAKTVEPVEPAHSECSESDIELSSGSEDEHDEEQPVVPAASLIDDAADGSGSDIELDPPEESDPEDAAFVDDDSVQADHMEEAASRQDANAEMDDRDNEQRAALAAQREKAKQEARDAEEERRLDQHLRAERVREEAEGRAARDAAARQQQQADEQASRDSEEQDSAADSGAFYHYVVLKNQQCPRMVAGIFQSNSSLSFTHNGVEIKVAGNNRTAGFSRSADTVSNGVCTYCLVLVDTVSAGEDAGLTWNHEDSLPQTPDTFMTIGSLKPALKEHDTPPEPNRLLGQVHTIETRLPRTIHVVPDLRPYIQSKVPLMLEADCATQKSRRIFGWLREMLRFNPNLRGLIVSCRIVHAIDIHTDLQDLEFGLYSDRNKPDTSRSRVVCQLNSIIHYMGQGDFDIVILDEIVSILAYFSLDNHTLSSKDGRRTYMQHVTMLERLCNQAQFLIMADAHMSMDGRVVDFMNGVVPNRTVRKLVLQGKNPACMRTLSITYSTGNPQAPQDMSGAVKDVLRDPEQRIAVCCASKRLLANELRPAGSYESELRKSGLDKIVMIHGDVGEVDKRNIFQNLNETLRGCQAFLANGSLTVGANPTVDFGAIFGHLHKNAALVRDFFQLVQRFGRSSQVGSGKLSSPIIHLVIHDASIEQKNADRQRLIAKGKEPAPRATYGESLDKVRSIFTSRQKDNAARLKQAPLATAGAAFQAPPRTTELPDWVIRVAAHCHFEGVRRDTMMTEEVLRYVKHHGWNVEVAEQPVYCDDEPSEQMVSPRSLEYRFGTLMEYHVYPIVYELVNV